MSHWLILLVAAVLLVVGLSVAPYPGHCNVDVTVQSKEVSFLVANYFSIDRVDAHTIGPAQILDWSAWLAGFGGPALNAQFSMTVSTDSGQSETLSQSQWFPTVPFVNGQSLQASNTFHLAQVPSGDRSFSVTLSQNGSPVASGSTTSTVGC